MNCNKDTINLLKECDSGTKMAVSSIDEILNKVSNTKLSGVLKECKAEHEKLGNEIHSLLIECGSTEKEPNPMAKGMSWLKTPLPIS